jgi:hypothetical protein
LLVLLVFTAAAAPALRRIRLALFLPAARHVRAPLDRPG